MTHFILVRHGQTEWNRIERFRGRADVPLNETGLAQAEATGRRVASEWQPVAIYSSPLSRAIRTADAISRYSNLSILTHPGLTDIHYGEWQGLTYAEVRQRYPYILQMRVQDPIGYAAPGGETVGQMTARVCAAIEEIAAKHDGGSVLVVTHGGPLRAVVCDLLAVEPRRGWRIMVENCSVTVIEITAGQPDRSRLVLFNDVCHLNNGHAHPL